MLTDFLRCKDAFADLGRRLLWQTDVVVTTTTLATKTAAHIDEGGRRTAATSTKSGKFPGGEDTSEPLPVFLRGGKTHLDSGGTESDTRNVSPAAKIVISVR